MENRSETALITLRQILRATEISGRALAQKAGITSSQLIILQLVNNAPGQTPGTIAKKAGITQATVTSIMNKLEYRELIIRHRDTADKRRIFVSITEKGVESLSRAPDLLQERFVSRFSSLADWEQTYLISALERVASMLDAENLDAAPILDVGAIDMTAQDKS